MPKKREAHSTRGRSRGDYGPFPSNNRGGENWLLSPLTKVYVGGEREAAPDIDPDVNYRFQKKAI